MKAVMLSLRPQWCEMIANGKKTIEVRKTRPKIETPFKCYIYKTKYEKRLLSGVGILKLKVGGAVIGSFVCDKVDAYTFSNYEAQYRINDVDLMKTCLNFPELIAYGKGKILYGWRISDLKIYDKPRELGEFRKPCGLGTGCEDCDDIYFVNCKNTLTRPPQSWCYVEDLT